MAQTADLANQSRQLRKILRQNEVPNCGCKVLYKPLCQHTNPQGCEGPKCVKRHQPLGCRKRQETGKCHCKPKRCDCPTVPGAPCKHILALRDRFSKTLTFDEWQELMASAEPGKFAEPVGPKTPETVLNKAGLVAMMEERASERRGLRHRGDLKPDDPVVDDVSPQAVTRKNGRVPNRLQLRTPHGGSNGHSGSSTIGSSVNNRADDRT